MSFDFLRYETEVSKVFNTAYSFVEEGLPLPIFYGELFNREQYMDFEKQKDFYLVKTKFKGEQIISEVNQSDGKPKFDFSEVGDKNKLVLAVSNYQNKLQNFVLDKTKNIIYLGIPSSESDIYNLPQLIGRKLNKNKEIPLLRITSKQKTHIESTGKRQKSYEDLTRGLDLSVFEWNAFDYIVLIDDVTTSGSSFRMIDEYLIKKGIPKDKIVNYAFYKHQSVEDWEDVKRKSESIQATKDRTNLIDGIIWDFDETIVNSRIREVEKEESLFDSNRSKEVYNWHFYNQDCLYEVYEKLNEIFSSLSNNSIPYALVSNRFKLMEKLFLQRKLREKIFPIGKIGDINFYNTTIKMGMKIIKIQIG